MSTIHKQLLAVGVLVSLGLTACSGSGTSPENATTSNLASNVLQFAVGTANLQGVAGLNVAATYRQPKGAFHAGDSAVFVSSPSLSGPFTMPATAGTPDGFFATVASGPAPAELGGHTMGATGQNSQSISTFGTSGGVIGLGIEPFNYNENGVPDSTTPYAQPMYDQIPSDPNGFIPFGGPPAFASVAHAATQYVSEGLDIFAVAPSTGAYSLEVSVPANTGTFHTTANAAIGSTALLPSVVVPTPVLDGNGGGTFNFTLPAGVTEAFIQITDIGAPAVSSTVPPGCNGAGNGALFYTMAVSHSGVQTLADTLGPGGTPTLCTSAQNTAAASSSTAGDSFIVQIIGFDYPWFEASYPNSLGNPNPPISGANGQADVTVSPATGFAQPLPSSGSIVRLPAGSLKTPRHHR